VTPPTHDETPLEEQERLLAEEFGRALTPREKFYLALAGACAPPEQQRVRSRGSKLKVRQTVAAAPPARSGKPLILCIDDDEIQLQLRKQILENDGFLVLNAANASEAIETLRETPVSLVLSDHMLRGTTGTQLAGELKKIKPEVPVVLYSGNSPESLENVDCFIAKSEPVPRFLTMIHDLVNRYLS
jgi:CheY-like chemotaxis protein